MSRCFRPPPACPVVSGPRPEVNKAPAFVVRELCGSGPRKPVSFMLSLNMAILWPLMLACHVDVLQSRGNSSHELVSFWSGKTSERFMFWIRYRYWGAERRGNTSPIALPLPVPLFRRPLEKAWDIIPNNVLENEKESNSAFFPPLPD